MKKTMELAGITASVVIGAGFATGREIRTYFTKYGNLSYVIIAGVTVLLYFGMLLLLRSNGGAGRGLGGKIIAVPYVFFGYILMLAALGQLVKDYTALPDYFGILVGTILSVFGLRAGFGRFTRFSGWVTPVVAVVLIGILLGCATSMTGVRPQAYIFTGETAADMCFSTAKFFGYNFLSAFIILPEIRERYTRGQKLSGVAIGVVGLGLCMAVINHVFLSNYNVLEKCEMPMIQAICAGDSLVFARVSVSLLGVIFVLSLCGSAVGIARMIAPGKMEFRAGLVFVILAVPLSLLGFGTLMDKIYPIFGVAGVFLAFYTGLGSDPCHTRGA